MTAVAVPATVGRPVVLTLARLEARRLVTHPAMLVGWAMLALMLTVNVFDPGSIRSFDAITTSTTFYPGLFCVLAAHMVTTRDHRAGATDLLGAVPATREQRLLALILAAGAPALIALVVNIVARQYFVWQDTYVEVPGLAHLVQGPVTVLGGSLLGIMLGLWLPQRATPVIAMVTLVSVAVMLDSGSDSKLFGPLVSWADWGDGQGETWSALEPGSPWAHVGYLLGLSGMAAAAAWWLVTSHRWLAVVLGLGFVVLAVAGGVAQLP
jgi:hypothetical protein